MHLQVVFFNHQPRPDGLKQLVLADRALAALDQGRQHVEGTGTQLGWLAVDKQQPGRGLQREAAEPQLSECVQGWFCGCGHGDM